MITFKNIPMPVSVNVAYSNVGKSRKKSAAYARYENSFEQWCYLNQASIKSALNYLEQVGNRRPYFLFWVFKFDLSLVLNKTIKAKEAVKQLDTSNRIKVIEDCVAELLGVNDSYFFDFLPMKRTGENNVDLFIVPIEEVDSILIDTIRNKYKANLDDMINYINNWNDMKVHKPQHLRSKGKRHMPKSVQDAGKFKPMYARESWRKLRALHLSKYPFCDNCGEDKNLHVDHRIAHKGNDKLFYQESNLVTLCNACHSSKTARVDQVRDSKGRFS